MNKISRLAVLIIGFILIAKVSLLFAQENMEASGNLSSIKLSEILNYPKFETFELDYKTLLANQGVKYCLPGMEILFNRATAVPELNQNLADFIYRSGNRFMELYHFGFRMLGATAGGYGPPLAGVKNKHQLEFKSKNLSQKEACLFEKLGFYFMGKSETEWVKLPIQLRQAILELIYSMDEAGTVIGQFNRPLLEILKKSYPDSDHTYEQILIRPWQEKQIYDFEFVDLIEQADLKKISFASRLLIEGILNFINSTTELEVDDFNECVIGSRWGKIGIYGTENDTIKDEFCLLVNLGGDDCYGGNIASAIDPERPMGVLIDLKGNDIYTGDKSLAKGTMGIGALFDLEGNDQYFSASPGCASSLFGTSVIYDAEGDDEYQSASDFSLGAAHVGLAVLCDRSGNDLYKSRNYSQAYGGTQGCGLLIDFDGNDIYGEIEDEQISFVQGAASGRWAEATDGQSLAGGIGMLIDYSGTDQYSAHSFSQAASYYFGLGLLYDKSGNDSYNAVSHSQGYAAHYALAALIENKGDDLFNRLTNEDQLSQIIGSGRDFASGWLIDLEGNDEYHFGNRSAGIGDLYGIGVFWDNEGDDAYFHHQNKINKRVPSLGKSIGMNTQMMIDFRLFHSKTPVNIGFHFDSAGKNTFNTVGDEKD